MIFSQREHSTHTGSDPVKHLPSLTIHLFIMMLVVGGLFLFSGTVNAQDEDSSDDSDSDSDGGIKGIIGDAIDKLTGLGDDAVAIALKAILKALDLMFGIILKMWSAIVKITTIINTAIQSLKDQIDALMQIIGDVLKYIANPKTFFKDVNHRFGITDWMGRTAKNIGNVIRYPFEKGYELITGPLYHGLLLGGWVGITAGTPIAYLWTSGVIVLIIWNIGMGIWLLMSINDLPFVP